MRVVCALVAAGVLAACGGSSEQDADAAMAADASAIDAATPDGAPPDAAPAPDAMITCGFVDWTVAPGGGPATGTLGAATITFTGASLGPLSTLDGTVVNFADITLHDPPVAMTDALDVRGETPAASYTLSFGGPATDVRLYLASFASVATFDPGVVLTKRSGDANLTAAGNVATGQFDDTPVGYDTNGIIDVAGTVTDLTFTVEYSPPPDGIYFQVYACR